MPFVEFAYNRTVHLTTGFSPFEIIYEFNPVTPMDLIPLSFEEMVSLDGETTPWESSTVNREKK